MLIALIFHILTGYKGYTDSKAQLVKEELMDIVIAVVWSLCNTSIQTLYHTSVFHNYVLYYVSIKIK